MAEQQPRPLMYSEKDIEVIKRTFADNEALLISIRKLFYGQDITKEEKDLIKSIFSNPEVVEVFRRKVYPVQDFNRGLIAFNDFWLDAESQIFGSSRDTVYQTIESKKLIKDMFEKAFNLLTNPDGEKVSIEYEPMIEADPLGIKLIARNLYIRAIQTALITVQAIAGKKEESVEDTVKRLSQNSSK